MANRAREFYYPSVLDSNGGLIAKNVDDDMRRIYEIYYSQYRSAFIFYVDSAGLIQSSRVYVGAEDSGGAGYRMIRIANNG